MVKDGAIERVKQRPELLIVLFGLVIALGSFRYRSLFPFDDTFITFRYAANLAAGHGLVWNIGGPHTEGFTNFLFVLLLGSCAFFHAPLLLSSQVISVIATLVTSIAIYRAISTAVNPQGTATTRWPSLLAGLLYLSDPFVWYNAWSGMETSLFVMFVMLSIMMLAQPESLTRSRNASVFAVAATLTRPEGAVLIPIILVLSIARTGTAKYAWSQVLLWTLLPLGFFTAWKFWYFGNVLPNSFYVKALQPQSGDSSHLHGLGGLSRFYLGITYLPALALLGLLLRSKTSAQLNDGVKASLLWALILTVFYLFPELMQPNYDRFFLSIEATLIIPACWGLKICAERINGKWVNAVLVTAVLLCQLYSIISIRHAHAYIKRDTSFDNRYEQIANVFSSIPHHKSITLAWGDAGKLPFYSGMRHIDPVGLNTNEIAHAKSVQEVLDYLADTARPDILIIPTVTESTDRLGCATVIRWGHGLIGHSYLRLATYGAFAGYVRLAAMPQSVYDLVVMVNPSSPHFRDITSTIEPLIGVDSIIHPPPRCFK